MLSAEHSAHWMGLKTTPACDSWMMFVVLFWKSCRLLRITRPPRTTWSVSPGDFASSWEGERKFYQEST